MDQILASPDPAVDTADDPSIVTLTPSIPVEDDPSPPETINLRLVDDIGDFADDEAPEDTQDPEADEQNTAAGFGADVVMDWDIGELFGGGPTADVTLVDGEDAVVEWAMKVLNIEPGTYAIYDNKFGGGIQDLIGSGLPNATLFSEITRRITDALTCPQIPEVDVTDLRFEPMFERDVLFCTISLTLDTDPTPVSFEVSF